MKHAGVDEHALAAAVMVSYQAIKKVLDGKTKEMSYGNLIRAARRLQVSPDWLGLGEGPMRGSMPRARLAGVDDAFRVLGEAFLGASQPVRRATLELISGLVEDPAAAADFGAQAKALLGAAKQPAAA